MPSCTIQANARAVGLWTASGAISIALGAVLGGLLVGTVGWRWVFFVNIPVCAAGLVLSRFLADSQRPAHPRPLDPIGIGVVTLGLFGLTEALIEIHALGLAHPLVWGGFTLAAAALAAFILLEARIAHPVVPLQLFQRGNFRLAVIYGTVVNLTYYGTVFALSFYFQSTRAMTAVQTGIAFLPMTAGFFVSNVISGRIVARYGSRLPMVAGALIDATGFFLLFFAIQAGHYIALVLPMLMIPGGMGLGVPAMTTAVLESVGKERAGVGSAILNTARQAAGALGVAIYGGMAASRAGPFAGLGTTVLISGCLLMLAAAVASRIGKGQAAFAQAV